MQIAALLLVAFLCSACIPIPLGPAHLEHTRTNVPDDIPDWLVAGRTTMADVFLRLGEPDESVSDQRAVAWVTIDRLSGTEVIVLVAPMAGILFIDMHKQRFRRLAVSFNQDWVVANRWMQSQDCELLANRSNTDSRDQFGGDCLAPLSAIAGTEP